MVFFDKEVFDGKGVVGRLGGRGGRGSKDIIDRTLTSALRRSLNLN
jgi:hypothetical protein